jgi:osmotically-inducible protein OsmY
MTQTTQQAHRTGHELRTAILDELEWTASVDADRVGVAVTDDGAIILCGEVSTYPEREARSARHSEWRG